jgi:hypothetical protein
LAGDTRTNAQLDFKCANAQLPLFFSDVTDVPSCANAQMRRKRALVGTKPDIGLLFFRSFTTLSILSAAFNENKEMSRTTNITPSLKEECSKLWHCHALSHFNKHN